MTAENFKSAQVHGVSSVPAGLVSVFAGEAGLPHAGIAAALARETARQGQSVLVIDCTDMTAARDLGVMPVVTLDDVINDRAALRDVKYITPDTGIAVAIAGQAALHDLLGPITAMSLSYDCVIVAAPSGCTPAHVQLAGAADASVMAFHAAGDRFMRAYWMLDAIRAGAPRCDPYMVGIGSKPDVFETYDLLAGTVRDFLGGPPPLGGSIDDRSPAASAHMQAGAMYMCEALTRRPQAAMRA